MSTALAMVKGRLPVIREIIPVYAVIAFMLFGWSWVLLSWNLPSWLNFMSPAHLFAVFSYSVATVFLESLLFLLLILIAAFILPGSWLKDAFAVRGSLLSLSALGLTLLRAYLGSTDLRYPNSPAILAGAVALLTLALITLSIRFDRFGRGVAWLADRLIVFLYLLIPISIISIITVLVRNVV